MVRFHPMPTTVSTFPVFGMNLVLNNKIVTWVLACRILEVKTWTSLKKTYLL